MKANSIFARPQYIREGKPRPTSNEQRATIAICRTKTLRHPFAKGMSTMQQNENLKASICKKYENPAVKRPSQQPSLIAKFQCEFEFWCHMTASDENP